jgi:hypothetical protein
MQLNRALVVASVVAAVGLFAGLAQAQTCSRFAAANSSAYNGASIQLPWRADLPATPGAAAHAWETVPLSNWQGYMAAVLSEIRASGLKLSGASLKMDPTAKWWITPWMDYGPNGRERNLGLTKERSPDPGDLSPTSKGGAQVWAVGFYNQEGASAVARVFADPCNPVMPVGAAAFPAKSASFKLLFSNISTTDVAYLAGGPTVTAYIGDKIKSRTPTSMRLLQMDIAVRDARSPTGWVFGTYAWKGPKTGDGLFDNLVPVGLMWGNDPAAAAATRDAFATLGESHINPALAGIVWRGPGQTWDNRPWPGFQGRLNGPADNLRSSCLSCHGLAQWPRSQALGIVPSKTTYSLAALNLAATRDDLRAKYLTNVPAGSLTVASEATPTSTWGGAVSLDYSMQLEAAFTRLCSACQDGALTGATPAVCRIKGAASYRAAPTCKTPTAISHAHMLTRVAPPPRQ